MCCSHSMATSRTMRFFGLVVFLSCLTATTFPQQQKRVNGKIVFMSTRDNGLEKIYTMDLNGSNQTRLTNNNASDFYPSWSPDGTRIAFTSNRDGDFEIYVMNADGSAQTRLTNSTGIDYDPTWSPDGSKIAFTSARDGNFEIYVMNADGSSPIRLTNSPARDVTPSWSPDGTKIAFASDRDGNFEIYAMSPNGSNQARLTNTPGEDSTPTWSPDSAKIAFQSARDGNFEIYVMNADGSGQTRLTNTTTNQYEPAWSIDGLKIAFTSDRDGNFEIYTMNAANGSNPVRMTNNTAKDGMADYQAVVTTQNNPIDDATFFVQQHYRDFLNREADGPGLAFWVNEIASCGNNAGCIDQKRVNTSGAYFISTEFQSTGYFVYRIYLGALGRRPTYAEFKADQQQLANGIVVANQLNDQAIENNKNAYLTQFITRKEFTDLYGSLSNQAYVDKLFANTKVTVSDADKSALVNGLSKQTEVSVLRKVLDGTTTVNNGTLQFTTPYGQAFYNQQFNPAFVLMQYFGYLRRDADADGYAFWLKKLNDFGNFTDAQMVRSFIVSNEYRARFGN